MLNQELDFLLATEEPAATLAPLRTLQVSNGPGMKVPVVSGWAEEGAMLQSLSASRGIWPTESAIIGEGGQ